MTPFARDEKKHYEFRQEFLGQDVQCLIGDVRDYERVSEAVRDEGEIIIHAAAMKHVTHAEDFPFEAVQTNVLGTSNVLRAADAWGSGRLILISSDKACAPVNAYGATKMLAEAMFQRNGFNGSLIVRYGNVLSSTGSVVPFFRALAKEGKALPVTHLGMTRFLLTAKEAVALVFKAIELDCEDNIILIPKPRSAKIADIINAFQKKYGVDYKIIGTRVGEKLHESLLSERDMGRISLAHVPGCAVVYPAKSGFATRGSGADGMDLRPFTSDGPLLTTPEVYDFLEREGEL